MSVCPNCNKMLLSQASARCNWCGQEIPDAHYQANAQQERDAYFKHQAERDAIELARTEGLNANIGYAFDPILGLPIRQRSRSAFGRGMGVPPSLNIPPSVNRPPQAINPPQMPQFGHALTPSEAAPINTESATEVKPAEPRPNESVVSQRFSKIDLDG